MEPAMMMAAKIQHASRPAGKDQEPLLWPPRKSRSQGQGRMVSGYRMRAAAAMILGTRKIPRRKSMSEA